MSRSIKKGPFVAPELMKRVEEMNKAGNKQVVKTWSRSSTIFPSFVGHTIAVHDGRRHVPVYVTEYAPKNAVEFGYFSYALVGQFGEMDIVVDPYTKATSNSVRFVLNTDFDIKAARAEAFGILKSANASGSN